jgi:HlyD family secretion protein
MGKPVKIAIAAVIVVLILLVVGKKQGWWGSAEAQTVEATQVAKGEIVETVIASGKIQPEVEVKISAEVSGEVIALPVKEGEQVEKGDLLVKINPDLFLAAVNRAQAALNTARASVASAKAQLEEARKNYQRNKALLEKKVISAAEFDAIKRAFKVAELNVESSQYQLQSARATLKEAQDNLERTTIYAPQTGTLSRLNTEVGERVVGTAQMAGTEILRVANLQTMEVLVEVNENDIIRVSKGDTAEIEVDAYLEEEFKGVVTEIANSARLEGTSIDQVTNFEVKVRVIESSYAALQKDSTQTPFRPGMTASVEIITQRKKDILTVPIEAVTTRTDTSANYKSYNEAKSKTNNEQVYEVVFTIKNGEAQPLVVTTGIQDDENIEIITGLEADETIITGPYSLVSKTLKKGMAVEVKDQGKPATSKED